MIYEYKPELVIFSEFGEELKAIRKDIVSKMSNAMKTQCLPGDIGLHIRIDNLQFFCCKSGSLVQKENIEVYECKDDLFYVSKTSFSAGEVANKQKAVEESSKKLFTDLIKSI